MIEKLESLGLTQTEARIYLFLLEHEEARAGQICAGLGLHTSHIYNLIEGLLRKGMASYKVVNNVKRFSAAPPSSLLAAFKEKEERLEKERKELAAFVEELKRAKPGTPRQNDFKYFEDVRGVKSMFMEFVESWERGSTVRVSSAPIAYERWNAFLLEFFHPPRVAKKVRLKIMLPRALEGYGAQRKQFPLTDIKYTDSAFPSEFGVAGEYVYFLSESERPYALLVKDKAFAQTQQQVFDQLWNSTRL